jgi:hypothetical protein
VSRQLSPWRHQSRTAETVGSVKRSPSGSSSWGGSGRIGVPPILSPLACRLEPLQCGTAFPTILAPCSHQPMSQGRHFIDRKSFLRATRRAERLPRTHFLRQALEKSSAQCSLSCMSKEAPRWAASFRCIATVDFSRGRGGLHSRKGFQYRVLMLGSRWY